MKLLKVFIIVSLMLAVTHASEPNDNYWEIIKQKMKEYSSATTSEESEAIGLANEEYFNSLSAEQLLTAARDCAAEIQQKTDSERWTEALWAMGFFWQYYPEKAKYLEDISPLLSDLQNTLQTPFWRYSIIQFLGDFKERLNPKQCLNAANVMNDVFINSLEPEILREKTVRQSTKLYLDAYRKNLIYDSNVVKKTIDDYTLVVRNIESGEIHLSEETVELKQQIEDSIASVIESQLAFFAKPDIETKLRSNIIASLIELRGFDDSQQIKQVLEDALQNYNNYDEKIWQQLVRVNKVYFENENSEAVLSHMLDKVQDKNEKRHLDWLGRKIDKSEIERASKPVMAVKLPPQKVQQVPIQVEPVDVNELLDWLDEIWLTDESLHEVIDPNQWQEFINSVKELQ
jgi:hypothetical protein